EEVLTAAGPAPMAGRRVLMCHGSPRRMNEFLWESTSSTQFLDWLARKHGADVVLCTHTGIHWKRRLPSGGWFVNVGCIGRPANDGRTDVWYTLISRAGDDDGDPARGAAVDRLEKAAAEADDRREGGNGRPGEEGEPASGRALDVEFVPVSYDHEALAEEMRREELPEEFVETILTGWWTTCLEVLPVKERRRGEY
ncbi:MAG: metallophosphoesterase, partial [Gemmatimonadota bacterium]